MIDGDEGVVKSYGSVEGVSVVVKERKTDGEDCLGGLAATVMVARGKPANKRYKTLINPCC